MLKTILVAGVMALTLSGCMTASEHRAQVNDDSSERVTAANVQREIKIGMSSAAVVDALGAPNLVTTDEKRREVWVYDKIATEVVQSRDSSSVFLLLLGGSSSAGAAKKSQRTLTVVIKFDEQSQVRDYAYRQSSF